MSVSLNRELGWSSVVFAALAGGCIVDDDGLETETTAQDVAVTWTNVVGATASGNTLTKTAPEGWGNAGAVSTQSFSSDTVMEFTSNFVNAGRSAGLSLGDSTQHHKDIDFSIHLSANGTLWIYEAGVSAGQFGTHAAGDVFRVESVEREVRYFRNGAALYTSKVVPQYPLLVDSAIYHTNGSVDNVQISDHHFLNTVGVTVTGNSLSKPNPPNAWNTAGARSVRTIKAGDGYVEFTTAERTRGKALGLSLVDTTQHFNTIRWSIQLGANSALFVYESGVLRGQFGTYLANDVFRVEVLNNQVRYLKNGTVFYTSTIAPTYPLFADAALFHQFATLNNITVVDTYFTSVVGADAIGNKLFGTGATGWGNAGAVAPGSIALGDGYIEFTTSETKKGKAAGLNTVSTSNHLNDIDYALSPGANGILGVYENGVLRGTFGAYAANDLFRVEVVGGVVRYLRNGTLLYTSTIAPTYPLLGDTALYSAGATLKNVTLVDLPDA